MMRKTPRQLADELVAAHPVFAGARDSYKVDAIQKVIEAAVAAEREWCADLVESPAATHLEMVAIYESEGKDPKTFRTHANALIEAAKAIRESGRFRDAVEAGKAGHNS